MKENLLHFLRMLPFHHVTNKELHNTLHPIDTYSLKQLPFYHITNIELFNTIETIGSYIKSCLENTSFTNHIRNTVHESNILKEPCKYYTCEDMHTKYKKQYKDGISLIHANIVSLDKHFAKLKTLMSSTVEQVDFVALSEIGRKNLPNRQVMLQKLGYNFEYEEPKLAKGGVGLLFNNNIQMTKRNDIKLSPSLIQGKQLEIEDIWYETCMKNPKDNYIIGVIYRHPGGSEECINEFSNQISSIMDKINAENKKCVIAGDLNLDALNIKKSQPTNNFFSTIVQHAFIPTITLPTRITEHSATLIDHILINEKVIKTSSAISAGNLFHDISDHLPIFILIKDKIKENFPSRRKVRIFGLKNNQIFSELLASYSWSDMMETTNPSLALAIYYRNWNTAFNKAFPTKMLSINRKKDKDWITLGLRVSIRHKNRLYQKYITHPTLTNKLKYTTYKNKLTECIRKAETGYYRELIKNEGNNLTNLWKIFGGIINPSKSKHKRGIHKLIINNKTLIKNSEIADGLNDYFSTIGCTLSQNIDNKEHHTHYLKNKHSNQQQMKR